MLDLLEKNAMSALSLSSVQYRSGVKLNGGAAILVVHFQSVFCVGAASRDPHRGL